MSTNLVAAVERVWGPMFVRRGFAFDSAIEVDEDGPKSEAVFYHNDRIRLQIYTSPRNGELNCMLAPLSSPLAHALFGDQGQWKYPQVLSKLPGVDLGFTEPARSLDDQLRRTMMWVDAHLDAAIANLAADSNDA